jgi:hypothetical protein
MGHGKGHGSKWKASVESVKGVRLQSDGVSAINPQTGEMITIAGADSDADIYIDGEWYPCFRWWNGRATFNASGNFEDPRKRDSANRS